MKLPSPLARLCLGAIAALFLGAWTVGPKYQRPAAPLTARWMGAPATGQAVTSAWWDSFGDPELSAVVARALAGNLDIDAARARVMQSRAEARAAGAALLPTVQAAGGAAAVSASLESPLGDLARNLPGFQRQYHQYQLGAQASWEIDLFGGLTRQKQAASARARASEADLAGVRVSVAAEAADAYLQVRAYQARIEVTRRQEAVQRDLVALVQQRAGQGVASDRELNQVKAALEGVSASLPPLQAGLDAELNRLDVLMGAPPGTWRAELAAPAPIPAAPQVTDAAGPPALLRRRPDVVAAEQRLIAANAAIGAALSDYYPKLSIAGLLGLDSISAARFFTGAAVEDQTGAGLRWRLFDFGRVDAEVAQARGGYAAALAGWRATMLRSAAEVEDAFSDLAQRQARVKALSLQVASLQAARRQAQQAYESGVLSLIEVRDADRELLTASDELAQTRADADRAAVEAFRALGGGWES